MKRTLQGLTATLTVAPLLFPLACSDFEFAEDKREGEQGIVRFESAGCNGSTRMVIGSKERLSLRMIDEAETLPSDLQMISEAPEIIFAERGPAFDRLDLQAHERGEARIQLRREGSEFDAITFRTARAAAVNVTAPSVALAGDMLGVVIDGVFGSCGNPDCRLFGYDFLEWRVVPENAATLDSVHPEATHFRVGNGWWDSPEPLAFAVVGVDRFSQRELVSHVVRLMDPFGVDEVRYSAQIMPLIEGAEEPPPVALPGEIPSQVLFCLRADAITAGGITTPVSRFSMDIRVEGDPGVLEPLQADHSSEPYGALFVAHDPGEVTLFVNMEILEREAELQITVGDLVPGVSGIPPALAEQERP